MFSRRRRKNVLIRDYVPDVDYRPITEEKKAKRAKKKPAHKKTIIFSAYRLTFLILASLQTA